MNLNPSLCAFFLCTADGQTAAFAEASVRTDYVNGCREPVSDTSPDNTALPLLHRAPGFTETERVIFYCQPLAPLLPPEKR